MKYKTHSAHTALFRNNKREILLILRRDIPIWVLPGGHSLKGENPPDTARREFYEETGLELSVLTLKARYFDNNHQTRKYLFISGRFIGNIRLNSEARAIEWFSIYDLPKAMTLYESYQIHDALKSGEINRGDVVNLGKEILNLIRYPDIFFQVIVKAFINRKYLIQG